ncbi:unnamed protein product [Mytilus coruscus]|uniref:SAP domain-containing protein n=1 Tax=Mytilus coruscus TaxID=42192 RepID=A0A6J8DQU9_MYTCO|nr:unnamed protein product [Mytilus coruscus]
MASSNAYQIVTLKEKDVPGAQLIYPEVENHSNVQLKRWLLCKGLTTAGNKSILIARVKDCIGTKSDVINVGVDDGKWYDLNLQEGVKDSESFQSTSNPQVPPIVGWKNFPSTGLPNHFNERHIHHYIIESVQFVGQNQTSKEEDECDIEDTSKPLQKGRQYFKIHMYKT